MKKTAALLLGFTLFLPACAGNGMSDIGSNLLSNTGLMSYDQARSLLSAGGKLAAAASPLSPEQEYYLGRGVSAMILSEYKLSTNSRLNGYVNVVGNVLAARSELPETFGGYHFAVLDTDEINALSAPGGFVFISRGFLKVIPDEDALAAVLAHEVGHIAKGHGVKAISQANVTDALMILGKQAASDFGNAPTAQLTQLFGDSVSEVFEKIVKSGYSRSQEYEADAYAAALLKISGYSSQSLLAMLTALETKGAAAESGGWASTHPKPEDRIDEISSAVKDDPKQSAGFDTRVARFKRNVRL